MGFNPRNLSIRPAPPLGVTAVASLVIFGTMSFGYWLECVENYRLVRFRDKSLLYGKPKAEGEAPSWGGDYWKWK
jgi:hypothetical protein